MAYAKRTKVPADRTRGEIEKLLKTNGASAFAYASDVGKVMIIFVMNDRRLRFVVPMPIVNKTGTNERDVARETARRWRSLLLLVKAKLEAVESKIVGFDEEFLAHIVIGGETVGDRWTAEAAELLADPHRKLPPLLGAGT
ncbi:MAG: hypothetical protein JWM74_5012 [Myxococcaceae bacterium]|nr:hypothetical protein [Myxococcaceae bacterium]